MATYATRGIVIGRHDFGEADRVMVLLTLDRGVIRGVAKGVRRIKSRLAGHLELFSESELMLAEGRNLDTLTSARLQHHLDVSTDYDKMRLAYLVAEMINRLSSEDEHHDGLFDLVHDTLEVLRNSDPDAALELWFKLRLLDRLGYRPQLGTCIICDTNASSLNYRFSAELGGIVDESCAAMGNHAMSIDQIKLWRLMLDQPFSVLQRVPGLGEASTKTLPICNAFYDYTFGRRFKSSEVLS